MAEQTPGQRIRARYSSRTWMYLIVFFALYYFAAGLIFPAIRDGGISWERIEGIIDNLSTEIIGAAVTFFIFELILEQRDKERDMLRALRQMNSIANDTAITGADELREEGLLTDGTLRGANLFRSNLELANLDGADLERVNLSGVSSLENARLWGANLRNAYLPLLILKGAYMYEANLEGADLERANASRAYLSRANLQRANLWYTNLQGAYLQGADLQGARFWQANLQGANLEKANLKGAYLGQANLQDVKLKDAQFDEETVLPTDRLYGETSFWTPDTDMTRFTDPEHPEFWRSDMRQSPAYRSDAEDSNSEE